MLEGRCQKCGNCIVGEALHFPRNQSCPICGASLVIFKDGKRVSEGYSPFTAEKFYINRPPNVPAVGDKTKDVTS